MEMNWSKPNDALSFQDTQQSPGFRLQANASANSYLLHSC